VSYSQFVDIDPDGWFSGQYFVFDTDVPDSTIFLNTSARYDVIITVRHNTAYPYNNLCNRRIIVGRFDSHC
jgi:hypothetical protein